MKIKWHIEAKTAIRQTASYIRSKFDAKSASDFVKEVYHTEKLLENNPHLGAVEPLLSGLPVMYRSIVVNRLNKLVYWINEDTIEIVAFWDTRREPKEQAKEVR